MKENITISLPKFPKSMVLTGRVREPLRILAEENGETIEAYYRSETDFTIEKSKLTKVFPISCTVLVVEDTLSETIDKKADWNTYEDKPEKCSFWETINGSFDYLSRALSGGAGVAINLSNIRRNGSTNSEGLVASGPVALLPVYSKICQYVRQGGKYKKGAVTVYLDFGHYDIREFLRYPKESAPYVKKAVYVSFDPASPNYYWKEGKETLREELLKRYNSGEIFIVKESYCKHTGERLQSNVCLEVLIPSRGSCNLAPINLGLLNDISELDKEVIGTIRALNEIRLQLPRPEIYLEAENDNQIGVGFIGLFNYMSMNGIKAEGLVLDERFNNHLKSALAAGDIYGKLLGLNRIWAIAPTVSCAMEAQDINGYTTSMNISPPLCHPITKRMERISEIKGVETIQYPPDIQSAADVDYYDYMLICDKFQGIMDREGMGHSISFDVWDTVTVDTSFMETWSWSGIVGLYYRQLVKGMSNTSKVKVEGMEAPKAQSLSSFIDLLSEIDDIDNEEDDAFVNEEQPICEIEPQEYCESCGG